MLNLLYSRCLCGERGCISTNGLNHNLGENENEAGHVTSTLMEKGVV